ncbi:MAG: methylisocitrate lyase, partial [Plesiomonas shigelloides]
MSIQDGLKQGKSPGARFRHAVAQGNANHGGPLKIVGTVNAYCALMAAQSGHQALYLSGAGVANGSFGLPDLGMTSLDEVLTDVRRITAVTDVPLLVDIDTGFGGTLNIARTIREMERAGAAAVHIEDQVSQKRCGHRPNKAVVSQAEMVDRIRAAVDARTDPDFVIMARTDALAVEGMDAAIERALACVAAGADMIFPEAIQTLAQYRRFASAVGVPVLANITEFGQTPLFECRELGEQGVAMVLYPLTAFRAMNRAAERVYQHLAQAQSQVALVEQMQTR